MVLSGSFSRGALTRLLTGVTALFALAPAAWAQQSLTGERVLVLNGATVFVGSELQRIPDATIVIRDGRITDIAAAGEPAPNVAGAEVVDLDGAFILPGLIDSHVHLGTVPNREQAESELRRLLRAGITSVRDMAGDTRFLADLARAATVGEIPSPRIYYSALLAGPTFFKDPRPQASAQGAVAGEVPWMQAVTATTDLPLAMALAKGTSATGVKIYGNIDDLLVWRISREAHRYGLQVWAHSTVFPARPLEVVKGGVDVVSHVCRLAWEAWTDIPQEYHHDRSPTADGFDIEHPILNSLMNEMVKRGTILDATLAMYGRRARLAEGSPNAAPGVQCDPAVARELVSRAHTAGVSIAAGTDFVTPASERPALFEELDELHNFGGLDITATLKSATVVGAMAIGVETDYGTIEVGKLADLVVLDADPTRDLAALEQVRHVIKGGQIVKVR